MIYVIGLVILVLIILVVFAMRLIANRRARNRHARQTARTRDAESLVATEFPGARPTLVGVARDVTDRVFVRNEGERAYEPYHRRDFGTAAVVRVEDDGDQDLPAYSPSTLPAPPEPVHLSTNTLRRDQVGFGTTPMSMSEAPPKYSTAVRTV